VRRGERQRQGRRRPLLPSRREAAPVAGEPLLVSDQGRLPAGRRGPCGYGGPGRGAGERGGCAAGAGPGEGGREGEQGGRAGGGALWGRRASRVRPSECLHGSQGAPGGRSARCPAGAAAAPVTNRSTDRLTVPFCPLLPSGGAAVQSDERRSCAPVPSRQLPREARR